MKNIAIIVLVLVITENPSCADDITSFSSDKLMDAQGNIESVLEGYLVKVTSPPLAEYHEAYSLAESHAIELVSAMVRESASADSYTNTELAGRILDDPKVTRVEKLVTLERSYGSLKQVHLEIQIPRKSIERSRKRLVEAQRNHHWIIGGVIIGLPVLASLMWIVMLQLDRWLLGDRRGILLGGFILTLATTVAGLIWMTRGTLVDIGP